MTENQFRFYQYIRKFIQVRGEFPCFEDMRQRFGYRSTHSVTVKLRVMIQKGFVVKKSRGNYELSDKCPCCGNDLGETIYGRKV